VFKVVNFLVKCSDEHIKLQVAFPLDCCWVAPCNYCARQLNDHRRKECVKRRLPNGLCNFMKIILPPISAAQVRPAALLLARRLSYRTYISKPVPRCKFLSTKQGHSYANERPRVDNRADAALSTLNSPSVEG
jgi:hypothetical protein